MSNKEQFITITVSGIAGSGKTAIAALLKNQLEMFGFTVYFEDPDGMELPCTNTIKKRINAIQDKGTIIDINEVQELRSKP